MKIIAFVKFNDEIAYVLDEEKPFKYKRIGNNIIYGTNGVFYICYYYQDYQYDKAFAGIKFNVELENGEVVECDGKWWSGGEKFVEKELNIELTSVTIETKKDLMKCYCFSGCYADKLKLENLKNKYTGKTYEYREYSNIIK